MLDGLDIPVGFSELNSFFNVVTTFELGRTPDASENQRFSEYAWTASQIFWRSVRYVQSDIVDFPAYLTLSIVSRLCILFAFHTVLTHVLPSNR